MNTPNLDALMNWADAGLDVAVDRKANLFATHGPALVAALKAIIVSHANGHSSRTALCIDDAMRLLVKLDQEATCQK